MAQDVVCPVLKAKDEEEEEEKPVTETSYTPDEGVLQIGNFKMSGARTFSIVLLIMITYCYLVIQTGTPDALRDLAFMACGYIFGIKTIKR
jgi:hypothetical protein